MKTTFNTGTSLVVEECQICGNKNLRYILFLGFLPPVNTLRKIGEKLSEEPSYPAQLLFCEQCYLMQLGLIVDSKILFPSSYPYTSSTTKILRDNFTELSIECSTLIGINPNDLIVDIGSNDGNLLSNFKDKCRVQGITPEEIGKLAIEKRIPTLISYFNKESVNKVIAEKGKAKFITATNVFAHIEKVHEVVSNILILLKEDGVFISESHYLLSLIQTLQYDTVYHEHLRYYSLHSLKYLLEMHGLEIFHAKKILTHGGSIRVYAARKGKFKVRNTVNELLSIEKNSGILTLQGLEKFKHQVVLSKIQLYHLFLDIKQQGKKVYGISAPSRASTLINYIGLDDGMLDYVLEITGSYKIGNYIPGTIIPIVEETKLFEDQPDYALLLSWHIAEELIPKLKSKGFRGKFIVPLPKPHIVE